MLAACAGGQDASSTSTSQPPPAAATIPGVLAPSVWQTMPTVRLTQLDDPTTSPTRLLETYNRSHPAEFFLPA